MAKKRLALNICGSFPDARSGRITEAMNDHGWLHDTISCRPPAQFAHAHNSVRTCPFWSWDDFAREVKASPAEVLHVHGELYDLYPVLAIKEAANGRPIILNVHDLSCAREGALFDAYEADALATADAHIWITAEQRDFATQVGLCTDKPHIILSNYPSSSCFIDKGMLAPIGGVVYGGGIDVRGNDSNRRDLSAIADALDGQLHVYPGGPEPDYGIVHGIEYDYFLYIHRLARHDWGFTGHPIPNPAWGHSMATKVGEYWAAGIPFVALNQPLMQQFADIGMGICIDSLKDLKRLPDPKPYRKAVMANRAQFTTQRQIPALVELYESLT